MFTESTIKVKSPLTVNIIQQAFVMFDIIYAFKNIE